MRVLRIALGVLGVLLAGAVFGTAGTISHTSMAWGLPVGLIVSAIGCAALLIALRLLTRGRKWTLLCGGGMLGALLVFSGEGPGGSVVVAAAAEGEAPLGLIWSYLLGGMVLLAVAWPDLSGLRAAARAE